MPNGPTILLKLEDFLPYRLSVLSNTVSSAIAALYAEKFDLSIPDWRVMAIVGRFDGLSAREVTERAAMDKVAVSRAVKRLVESGRLTRTLSSDDRRRSMLALTPRGRNQYRRVAPLAMDYEKSLLEGFTPDEIHGLNALLEKLLRRSQAIKQPD